MDINHKPQTQEHISKRVESRRRANANYMPLDFIPWNKGLKKETDARINECAKRKIKGRKKHSAGYVEIYMPEHPNSNRGYIFEHIAVLEKKLGRYLYAHEDSHHINGIKDDNRPENLVAMSKSEHTRLHATGRKRPDIVRHGYDFICSKCGKSFYRNQAQSKQGAGKYCSWMCRYGKEHP